MLDDGFFSIDEFNRETEELESKTRSRGSLGADDEEDEADEEVDYFVPVEDDAEAFEEDDDEESSAYSECDDGLNIPLSEHTISF
jgi:U3 small nucleolar RNA-associated protein MPP10